MRSFHGFCCNERQSIRCLSLRGTCIIPHGHFNVKVLDLDNVGSETHFCPCVSARPPRRSQRGSPRGWRGWRSSEAVTKSQVSCQVEARWWRAGGAAGGTSGLTRSVQPQALGTGRWKPLPAHHSSLRPGVPAWRTIPSQSGHLLGRHLLFSFCFCIKENLVVSLCQQIGVLRRGLIRPCSFHQCLGRHL